MLIGILTIVINYFFLLIVIVKSLTGCLLIYFCTIGLHSSTPWQTYLLRNKINKNICFLSLAKNYKWSGVEVGWDIYLLSHSGKEGRVRGDGILVCLQCTNQMFPSQISPSFPPVFFLQIHTWRENLICITGQTWSIKPVWKVKSQMTYERVNLASVFFVFLPPSVYCLRSEFLLYIWMLITSCWNSK